MADVETVQIDSRDLISAITGALTFASRDEWLPMICCVSFAIRPGHLYLTATDRYCLGQIRIPIETDARADFLLQRAEIARLVRYFRPVGKAKTTLKLELSETLTVEESGTIPSLPGVRASFNLFTGSMPPVDTLLKDLSLASEQYVQGFNPQFMARFAKVQRGTDTLRMTPLGEGKPTLITIGDYFRGLIMPVRPGDTDKTGDAWPSLIEPDPPAKTTPKPRKTAAKPTATSRKKAS